MTMRRELIDVKKYVVREKAKSGKAQCRSYDLSSQVRNTIRNVPQVLRGEMLVIVRIEDGIVDLVPVTNVRCQ